jgi:hypothetical protein
MTRRRKDLELLFEELRTTSTVWLFRGLFESETQASWLNASENEEYLQKSLSSNVGTEKQTQFYSRLLDMASRIIDAGSENHTTCIMKDVMGILLGNWCIKTIIIYCRVSPYKGKTAGCTTISLERQLALLKMFCPPPAKLIVVREDCSSAYADTERLLVPTVVAQEEKCCLLAVSLDRILRRSDALSHLRSVFAERGHIGVCFLWDCYTTVSLSHGLGLATIGINPVYNLLENALKESRRTPASPACLPVLQPIVWTTDSPLSPSSAGYEAHMLRHANNAELHCEAFTTMPKTEMKTRAPQQLMQVDATLLRTESRDWSAQRKDRWESFVNSYLHLELDQLDFLQNNKGEWVCHCDLDKLCDMMSCLCDCKFCRGLRQCPCEKEECTCPEICNCSCDHCHLRKQITPPGPASPNDPEDFPDRSNLQDRTSMKPPEPASRSSSDAGGLRELSASEINQSTGPRQYSVEKRQCSTPGCTKPSSQRSWKRYLCAEHDRKRKADEILHVDCLNRGCLKKRSPYIPYCSLRCYEDSVKNPRLCEVRECLVPCPPDLKVTRCLIHHEGSIISMNYINIREAKEVLEGAYHRDMVHG